MTDEESPTESQPPEFEPTQAAPIVGQPAEALTEVIPPGRPWWRRPGVLGLLAGGVALITAIALVVVLVVLPDGSQQAEEQVFLTPLDDPGADPFTEASMATPLDPTMTNPGPDPAGVPPADPNATRTVYGDTDGLFGGTRNESTCDGQGLINYLQQQPAKAAAWASVHKISVDQIPGYIQQLTPVRLRSRHPGPRPRLRERAGVQPPGGAAGTHGSDGGQVWNAASALHERQPAAGHS